MIGSVLGIPANALSKIHLSENGCWIWQGAKTEGYGRFMIKSRRMVLAHRLVWESINGPIQSGLVIDHLCRVPACVNPSHLEPVSNRENTVRGLAAQVNKTRMLSQSHCKNGHSLDGPEAKIRTATAPTGGFKRVCKVCERARARRNYLKNSAKSRSTSEASRAVSSTEDV